MSYVPMPMMTPSGQDSPRVRELSREIQTLVEDYRQRNPRVTSDEISAALHAARSSSGGSRAAAIALVVGLVVAFVAGVVVYFVQSGAATPSLQWALIGVISLVAILALALKRRS